MKRVVKQLRHGQITIPKDLRKEAGIEPGDLLEIELVEGKLQVEPVHAAPKESNAWLKELYEIYAPVRKKLRRFSEQEINDAIDEAVKEVRADKP